MKAFGLLSFSRLFRDFFIANLAVYSAKPNEDFSTKADGSRVGPRDSHLNLLLSNFLIGYYPLPVVSEEQPHTWPPPWEDFWLVDPFDGTDNDYIGLPLIGSMVTLVEKRQPTMSAIFLPVEEKTTGEGFCLATKTIGVWHWNPTGAMKRRVSTIANLAETTLLLEGSSKPLFEERKIRQLVKATARTRVDLGCAWSFTRLASSREVVVVSLNNKPTDNLHGILFAEESGGRVTDFDGNPPSLENYANLIFSNGLVHNATLEVLSKEERI